MEAKQFTTRKEALEELKRERSMRDRVFPRLMDPSRPSPLHPDRARRYNDRLDTAIAVFLVMSEEEFTGLVDRYQASRRPPDRQISLPL